MEITNSTPVNGNDSVFLNETTAEAISRNAPLTTLFGFLGVIAISLLPLLALAMRPLRKHAFYKPVLLFLMALAVGILVTTSFLFLLPDAIGLDVHTERSRRDYIYKISVYYGTFVFFLNFEIIFKQTILHFSLAKKKKKVESDESTEKSLLEKPIPNGETSPQVDEPELAISRSSSMALSATLVSNENLPGEGASVVWVILVADGIHNFVDGVAVGSTIARSFIGGLIMVLVIFVEELPHKLGDIAVLLHNGIPNCRAILYSWLAALPCYVGYFIGVLVGNVLVWATPWIYSVAAALFVYTALADILPECVEEIGNGDTDQTSLFVVTGGNGSPCKKSVNKQYVVRLLLTNFGLVAGFVTAAVMAGFENKLTQS